MKTQKTSRPALALLVFCFLVFAGLAVASPDASRTSARQVFVRAVSLGTATLAPTTISANGTAFGLVPATATITVTVSTSSDVQTGTIATVDLSEVSNTSSIGYSVSGGQRNNGRTWDVTLRGGGNSETIRYQITGQSTNDVGGSVQFKATLRSVTAPSNGQPPAPVTEEPLALTDNLTLTFQVPPPTGGGGRGGGGGIVTFCNREVNPDDPDCTSPVLVDIDGDGFSLTDAQTGVDFDLDSDGYRTGTAWTVANSDDAWLALDRNGDGQISLGVELFGNFTPQAPSENRNGFLALAEFDKPESGGNNDGVVDASDQVFKRLRLWQDTNHNGISEPDELHTLPELGVTKFELSYKESRRTDEYGNQFRYRAKVWGNRESRASRWAWDIFLVPAQ